MVKIKKRTKTILSSSCLFLAMILGSCTNNNSGSGSGTVVSGNEQVMIQGAGASFPAPLYQKWIQEYTDQQKNIVIKYDSVGSGTGIKYFVEESVDFGATDAPLKQEDRQLYP